MRKCENPNCRNELTRKQKRFCSRKCLCHIMGKISAEKNRKNKAGCFFNKKIQSRMGKRVKYKTRIKACITNRKNKTGFCHDKELQSGGGKRATITNRKNKKDMFHSFKIHSENGKKAVKTNRKNKTSMCFDKELQSKGGLNSQKTLRQNHRNLFFKGQYYDSPQEIEMSICLQKQFDYIPKEGKTLHIQISRCEYDYLLEKLKAFIEYHLYRTKNETEGRYYIKRRKNLNKNGYKNYELIIIF